MTEAGPKSRLWAMSTLEKYLTSVLGLKELVMPVQVDQSVPELSQLKLVFLAPDDLDAVEWGLLTKMIDSFGLQSGQSKVVSHEAELKSFGPDLIVVNFFEKCNIPQALKERFKLWVNTYGPREIMKDQQLKKKTWDDFKKVMKCLKD